MTVRQFPQIAVLLVPFVLTTCEEKRETLVQFSADLPGYAGNVFHATCEYDPMQAERKFYERLDNSSCETFHSKPAEFGNEVSTFMLHGHEGQFVSWFGVVRQIERNSSNNGGVLLIENKYFMGLTDCDIQSVEINGAGDFKAELTQISDDLVPLVLVRVYGTVAREENGLPVIKADYLRVWHWGQFNFYNFGEDRGNPRWKENGTCDPDSTFEMNKQGRNYYKECIGPTPEQWNELKRYYGRRTRIEFSRFRPFPPDMANTPTESEQEYFDKLSSTKKITVRSRPDEPLHLSFSLRGHVGEFVSWFGIVRKAMPAIFKPGGTLLVENKYFDGASDETLQTVSINGGGNFTAELTRFSQQIMPLMLVRVYGVVIREEWRGPVVQAAYIRAWPWGRFNLKDYGLDRGDRRWKKNLKLTSSELVHQTCVSPSYYEGLLGSSSEQKFFMEAEMEGEKESGWPPSSPCH